MATQPGLDGRHRDKDGEISKKHGNTLISTLRETYGPTSPGESRTRQSWATYSTGLTSPRSPRSSET
jgi:hypothetical protein